MMRSLQLGIIAASLRGHEISFSAKFSFYLRRFFSSRKDSIMGKTLFLSDSFFQLYSGVFSCRKSEGTIKTVSTCFFLRREQHLIL